MENKKIKFAFFGTPDIAAQTLEILKQNGFEPSLIVTSPDRPQGRKMLITPPPVKVWAEANNIPILQPEKIDENFKKQLEDSLPRGEFYSLYVVVAYGKIFPEWLIDMPKKGTLNIHYSLLPKYRGASPVQSAILNGDTETGVTIQKMVSELDAGPIVAVEKIEIEIDEKTPELLNRLAILGAELLSKTLPEFIEDKIELTNQNHSEATFCKKIKKEDGLIDLKDDAIKNYNKFRAFYEWPRTYFFKNGKRFIITQATRENSLLKIEKVLPEGKKEVDYKII